MVIEQVFVGPLMAPGCVARVFIVSTFGLPLPHTLVNDTVIVAPDVGVPVMDTTMEFVPAPLVIDINDGTVQLYPVPPVPPVATGQL